MRTHVIGFEISEGTSSKSGKPYAIGKLHAIVRLAEGMKGNLAKGSMGHQFRCETTLLRKIEHLQPPFFCDVEFENVMRFGELQQEVVTIIPTALDKGEPGKLAPLKAA